MSTEFHFCKMKIVEIEGSDVTQKYHWTLHLIMAKVANLNFVL